MAYHAVGRLPEAITLSSGPRRPIAKLGPDHPDTLTRSTTSA